MLDRIDIHIDVPAVKFKELASDQPAESSAEIRDRVVRARRVQLERFASERIFCNAQMSPRLIRKYCLIDSPSKALLENAITRLGLSACAYDRILKVSRTLADLEGRESIKPNNVSEAIQYRTLDRTFGRSIFAAAQGNGLESRSAPGRMFVRPGPSSYRAATTATSTERAVSLAYCVTYGIFFDPIEQPTLATSARENGHVIDREICAVFADEQLSEPVLLAYAALLIALGWRTRDPFNFIASKLVERATKNCAEIPNIVQMWGAEAIVTFFRLLVTQHDTHDGSPFV